MQPGKTREDEIAEQRKKLWDDLEADTRRRSDEQQRREEAQSRDPSYKFIYHGVPIINGADFTSSNVMWIQFDLSNSSLYVTFKKNGCTYRYWPVSVREAKIFFDGASKGKMVWDILRKRGTKLGHQKNYILVGGSAVGTLPKWVADPSKRQEHDHEVAATSDMGFVPEIFQPGQIDKQPYRAVGKFLKPTEWGTAVGSKETTG
jgi:hypothetical protein